MPYLKRINSLPLINHISYKYAQVSDIGPSWSSCSSFPTMFSYLSTSNFVIWATFNPFPNKSWFLCICSTSFLKTLWEKEKLLITSNFSFSHSVFNSFGELSAIFTKSEIVICKLFHFGKFVIWERVKRLSADAFNLDQSTILSLGRELTLS